MEYQYKRANENDIDVLTQFRVKVLRAANLLDDSTDMSQVEKESYAYYKEALANGSHIAYLVYDGQEIIGSGGVSFYQVMPTYHNPTGRKAYIMNMYTHPNYRRKGIAYKTLDLLVTETKKLGITSISLDATAMGRPLYQAYGFQPMPNEMELELELKLG